MEHPISQFHTEAAIWNWRFRACLQGGRVTLASALTLASGQKIVWVDRYGNPMLETYDRDSAWQLVGVTFDIQDDLSIT